MKLKIGGLAIPRKNGAIAQPPQSRGPRINDAINAPRIRLIDGSGENKGIVTTDRARALAKTANLDLVEISPDAEPPVCKLLDYGKYKYRIRKKANEARKKQKTFGIKEIKMRPNIDTHDYEVKMRNMKRFFADGDKVKVTLRFRGREMAHPELGQDLLTKVCENLNEIAKVEAQPKLEGHQMIMVLAPR